MAGLFIRRVLHVDLTEEESTLALPTLDAALAFYAVRTNLYTVPQVVAKLALTAPEVSDAGVVLAQLNLGTFTELDLLFWFLLGEKGFLSPNLVEELTGIAPA